MFRELKNILNDSTFKIVIFKDKIYLNNYEDILVFEDTYLLVKTVHYLVKIKGENLTISKLENNEIAISGLFKSVELGD